MPRKSKAPRKMRRRGRKGGKKAKAAKNQDTFSLICRSKATAIPQQGGLVANYLYLYGNLINVNAAQGVLNNAEYRLFQNIYDQVRINKVVMKVKPKANFLSLESAQNDGFNTSGDNIVHTCIDRNSAAAMSTEVFMRYSSYKKFSVMKPFSRSYSITYPDGIWLDCRQETVDTTLLQRLGALGGVFVYLENILEDNSEIFNEPWAAIEWEYHCVFRGKNIASLTFANDGTCSLKPPELLAAPVATPLINVRGGSYETGETDMKVHYQTDEGGGDQGTTNFDPVNPVNFTPVA